MLNFRTPPAKSLSHVNAVVVDNDLATPCPQWTAFMQRDGRPIDMERDLLLENEKPPTRPAQGLVMEFPNGPELWIIQDLTGRNLQKAEADILSPEVDLVIMLVNTADYNPRTYKTSARFERDRALLDSLCRASWTKDALILVGLEGVQEFRFRIADLSGTGGVNGDGVSAFLNVLIGAFHDVGTSHPDREVRTSVFGTYGEHKSLETQMKFHMAHLLDHMTERRDRRSSLQTRNIGFAR